MNYKYKSSSFKQAIIRNCLFVFLLHIGSLSEYEARPGDKVTTLNFRSVPQRSFAVQTTKNVVLQCEAGGNPPPKIYWLKEGKRISQSVDELKSNVTDTNHDVNMDSVLGLSFTRSKLFLDCVHPDDSAVYSCVAETPYNLIVAKTHLNVLGLANNESRAAAVNSEKNLSTCASKKSNSTSARIHMWTHNRLEIIGKSVQLYCRSSGSPKVTVAWNGPNNKTIQISNSNKYLVLENGDLVIHKLSWPDMGGYTCHVHNKNGNDTISTFLYPTLPENSEASE